MSEKILITPRSLSSGDHPQLQRLRDAGFELFFCTPGQMPNADELRRLLPGCAGYLAGVEAISGDLLRAAKGLKVIARNGVGINNVDLDVARELGIAVCPAPGANARGVAELAIALLLAAARAIPFSDRAIKTGQWSRRTGMELEGKTLGIVGCGNIGRRVARMAVAMDMRVVGYDLKPDPAFRPGDSFRYAPLDEVLESTDMLTLHCPTMDDGRPLLDAGTFARLKKGVVLVNTARADLIDMTALAAAMASGQVAAVGLDVFDPEPPGDDPLLRSDRVIATPHIGGLTHESIERAVQAAVDNLLQHLGGA